MSETVGRMPFGLKPDPDFVGNWGFSYDVLMDSIFDHWYLLRGEAALSDAVFSLKYAKQKGESAAIRILSEVQLPGDSELSELLDECRANDIHIIRGTLIFEGSFSPSGKMLKSFFDYTDNCIYVIDEFRDDDVEIDGEPEYDYSLLRETEADGVKKYVKR